MKTNLDAGILSWRLTLGILMLMHGVSKLFNGISFIEGLMEDNGLPVFLAYGVYVGEVIAPLLLIIGFRTKIAAAIFAFSMLAAVFLAHSHELFEISGSGAWAIETNALFLFGAVGLIFTGGGKYAVSTKSEWD